MSTQPPAGWYPDPGGSGRRWWDGQRWTDATQPEPAVPAGGAVTPAGGPTEVSAPATTPAAAATPATATPAPSRPRRGTGVVLAVLALLVGGGIGAIVVYGGDDDEPPAAQTAADAEDAADAVAEEDDDVQAAAADPDDAAEPADTDDDTDEDAGTGHTARAQRPTRTVDLDGQCSAEVDADVAEHELRAWELPECLYAPVDPDRDGDWVVVATSLNGEDFGAADAEQRARELGLPGRVLWSSHYASLNEGLWVVYDGPFPTETAAESAATAGTYPRVLSDDPGDRYCAIAEGCDGERAR